MFEKQRRLLGLGKKGDLIYSDLFQHLAITQFLPNTCSVKNKHTVVKDTTMKLPLLFQALCRKTGPGKRECTCRALYNGDGYTCLGSLAVVM